MLPLGEMGREFWENGSDAMLLGGVLQQFIQCSPVAVMVNGILQRVFDAKLEELSRKHAVWQSPRP